MSIPRRNRLDLNTPAELAIYEAIQVVERAGAHPLLTEAVNLLGAARDRVADYVDLPPCPEEPQRDESCLVYCGVNNECTGMCR